MINSSFKSFISFISLMLVSLLLSATAVIDPATMPYSTIASYAVNTTNLESVSLAYAYRPWFENGSWQGDIVQFDLLANGSISTTVDLSTNPPTNSNNANGGINWSARLQFIKNTNNYSNNYFQNQRKIITTNGVGVVPNQIPFTWNSLTSAQQLSLDATPVSATKSNILDYIRGSRSNEVNWSPGGLLRQRYSILGDIVHADPVYVAEPRSMIFDPGYALYKRQNVLRAPRLYAGANDGMLHVFNASTGDEIYAYIPSMLIGKLNLLAKLPYQHQYYVDGALTAGDMDFGNINWHSILVGSLGAGGKGLFALDISNPDLGSESSLAAANNKVLWELDGSNLDVGYIYDKAEIANLPDGNWYVITGNGYSSTNDVASLLLINSQGVITTIEANNTITANGLSRPTLIDTNGDGAVDFAYAGDIQGNLYRFDLNSKAKADLLFSAGTNKPITTAPKITNHPNGGRIVLFGTGSLLSKADVTNTAQQSLYGIRDTDIAQFVSNTNLINHSLSADIVITNPPIPTRTIRTIIEDPLNPLPINWTTRDGWKVDLPVGERVVLDPNLRAGRFQIMSINPVTKAAWLIQVDFYDGAANSIFYDLNDDQIFDALDTVNFPVDASGAQTGPGDIPVGVKQGTGSFSRQLITRVSNGVDANFINGLGLPVIDPPKTGKVPGGFAHGHIDVDTDSPVGGRLASNIADQYCYEKGNRAAGVKVDASGALIPPSTNSPFVRTGTGVGDGLSGMTDGHQHEYDKAHGTVEVDYINLELHCKQMRADNTGTAGIKLNRVTEVGIGNAKEFFVIIANADLSPGSELNIGNESWNVVEYQKLIQQKLDAWKAAGAVPTDFAKMMVDNGKPLIYTLNKILTTVNAGTGKFTNSFNNRAIIDGGLHPTMTSCVKSPNPKININKRWRNGALVTQLIDVNKYKLDPTTVVKQVPTDLPTKIRINGTNITLKEVTGEIYGGLEANRNNSITGIGSTNLAFLYESTLFWHFCDLYDLTFKNNPNVINSKPCYGDSNWAAAKAYEIAGLNPAQLNALINDPTNALGKAKLALDSAKATGNQANIDQAQKNYDKEYSKIADYVNTPGSGNGNPNQPSTIGTPVNTNNNTVTSRVLGPNSKMGRRAWIDIRP